MPFYSVVRVKKQSNVPAEVVGKLGIILGRAGTRGRWDYSVFVQGVEESYSLPHSALAPTGKVLRRDELYGGDMMRVRIGDAGAGRVVGEPRR